MKSRTFSRRLHFVLRVVPLLLVLAFAPGRFQTPAAAQPIHSALLDLPFDILNAASPDSVAAHVFELADGKYFGRATGSPELLAAQLYVSERLSKYGVAPAMPEGSYFQSYHVGYNYIKEPAWLSMKLDGDSTAFEIVAEFLPHQFSGSGRFDSVPLVLADSAAFQTGFEGVSGKAVMYFPPRAHDAPEGLDPFEMRRLPNRHIYEAARRLSEAGAAAMLVAGTTYGRIGMKSVENLPIFDVTAHAVEKMVVEGFETVGTGIRRPVREVLLSGEANNRYYAEAPTANVIGVVRGTDPALRDEVVIVCAHVDHVGSIAGQIHYGAHDNASGTAVMLEVARMLQVASEAGFRPRRSIVFIGFAGEEMALVGSRYYVEEAPVFPLSTTTAVLNLDILGGGTGFMVVGGETWPNYFELVSELNDTHFGHSLQKRDNAPNSDHFYFGHHGIPAAFFYALTGPPVGIHTPTDTADRMDPEFMADAVRFAFSTTWRLANLDPEGARALRERSE